MVNKLDESELINSSGYTRDELQKLFLLLHKRQFNAWLQTFSDKKSEQGNAQVFNDPNFKQRNDG